jgi:two-component system invasion response regulator UvrY
MIRVLIVEERPTAREGLRRLLASSGEIVVVADVAEAALAGDAMAGAECDVAVLGLPASVPEALARLAALRQVCPALRILTVGQAAPAGLAGEALKQGASGYLEMGRARDDLVNAVRLVCRGSSFVSAPLGGPGSRSGPRASS